VSYVLVSRYCVCRDFSHLWKYLISIESCLVKILHTNTVSQSHRCVLANHVLFLVYRQQYNVASKSVFVLTVELLDSSVLECTLSAESTGR
jgi:hypothetical protein